MWIELRSFQAKLPFGYRELAMEFNNVEARLLQLGSPAVNFEPPGSQFYVGIELAPDSFGSCSMIKRRRGTQFGFCLGSELFGVEVLSQAPPAPGAAQADRNADGP
ncbi:hypothetical protein [Catenulispora pinisilvae]|uniref:hypothetical protein n=1 Tax=Catenulispora pinisilvae TaxID=2705253 RepID=UPI00189233B8|nr:hypothetical protein [Catenulispora pinisilvae]